VGTRHNHTMIFIYIRQTAMCMCCLYIFIHR
jgi:hypothetical protein